MASTNRAPAPAPAPAPAKRRGPAGSPSLRMVHARARRPRYGVLTVIGIGAVFAVFFGLVLFHTVLLQNQRKLDQLDTQVSDEQAHYQQLRLQVAQLESPERILEVATAKLGLVPSDNTTYLTPSGPDAVAARQAQAADGASDSGAAVGGSADGQPGAGAQGWLQVKPYLGATP